MSIAAGFKRSPRCVPCLARALDREPDEFRRHALTYIRHRDCYLGAWEWTSARERSCPAGDHQREPDASEAPPAAMADAASPLPEAEMEWDAGDMACGDLVLELRHRLRAMRPGATLRLVARDPGATEDIPAWCRMTGHPLRAGRHPVYVIERRHA